MRGRTSTTFMLTAAVTVTDSDVPATSAEVAGGVDSVNMTPLEDGTTTPKEAS